MGWFGRLKDGLKKTRNNLVGRVKDTLSRYNTISPEMLDEIEELLVTSDMGVEMAMEIIEKIKTRVEEEEETDPGEVEKLLRNELKEILDHSQGTLSERANGELTVILVMGVNGSGKTTTIAKLAKKHIDQGQKVVFSASDTFRAAAIEQLQEWANRTGATLINHDIGADPSAVAYDAVEHSLKNNADLLLIDTAGRLQTKHNLMKELEKINRVIEKRLERHIDEKLLTIDATNGQNGISQAEKFDEAVGLSGIVLTKLDSTAKGGVIFPIVERLEVPIKLIGVGENEEDLHQFDADEFIDALFR